MCSSFLVEDLRPRQCLFLKEPLVNLEAASCVTRFLHVTRDFERREARLFCMALRDQKASGRTRRARLAARESGR